MDSEKTWNRVESVFNQALTLPDSEREPFVIRQCGDDSTVREQVLKLLGARAEMGDFLQAPIVDFTGQHFGPYRAVREIGRGGMSVVYLGERTDGDFEKQVAIKVILLQSSDPVHRGETQILASLEHANVARLLDSGVTPLGFRYLVMEYVEGTPLTAFCSGLGKRARLGLFLQVCAGVQFAHRSLVVHRDLKPDNILVTSDGTVKLLDFGIAKILSPEPAGPQTTGVRAWTPDYASPEQILGLPVTTSTDIYSLGVLLCELVGGRLPRSLGGLPIARIVEIAGGREVDAVPLTGDLAVIAHKALRRDPSERYESASALARDVERYLAGRPIEARTPTLRYRATKFVARNRFAVGGAALAFVALALTAAIAVWQARLAGMRFEQVRGLSRSVMFELHDAVQPLPGSLAARKMIVDLSLGYLNALAGDTNASEEVQLDVARGYARLADILGRDYERASLGRTGEALERARQSVAIARRVLSRNPRSIEAHKVLIDGLDRVASAHTVHNELEPAIAAAQEAVEAAERLARSTPNDRGNKERLANVTMQLAGAYVDSGREKESVAAYRRAVALRKEILAADPASQEAQVQLARSHNFLGYSLNAAGDYGGAMEQAREAYRIDKAVYEAGRQAAVAALASDIGMLASLTGRKGDFEEEVRLYHEQLRLRREIAAREPKDLVTALRVGATLDRLGYAYQKWQKYPEAIHYGEEALKQIRAVYSVDPRNQNAQRELIYALVDLGASHQKANHAQRSCTLATEAQSLLSGPAKALAARMGDHTQRAAGMAAACR